MNRSTLIRTAMVAISLSAIASAATPQPRVFTWRAEALLRGRELAAARDPRVVGAVDALVKRADTLLREPDVAVTDKPDSAIAPTGDRHDYVSVSIYFWPDPKDPKAAWIPRDGVRNDEAINQFDSPRLFNMCDRVVTFAQAYWFTGEQKYARAAAAQLDRWFIAADTRMNPNMNFAQSWPNKNAGTPWGIIDSNRFYDLLNAVGVIADSGAWTAAQDTALKTWFREWNRWLLESELGRKERVADNNHGIYYDLQLVAGALYCGDEALARQVLNDVKTQRIDKQIEPDGSMPKELGRVDAWGYTGMNLKGLMNLALMAEPLGIDLWHYESADGRSLRKAIEWTIPYLQERTPFTWGNGKHPPSAMVGVFWHTPRVYGPSHRRVFDELIWPALSEEKKKTDRLLLLEPIH